MTLDPIEFYEPINYFEPVKKQFLDQLRRHEKHFTKESIEVNIKEVEFKTKVACDEKDLKDYY